MIPNRPVVISVIQYQDELKAGTLTITDLIDKLDGLGVDGIELRRELWEHHASELPAVRDRLRADGRLVTYATFSTLFSADEGARNMLRHDILTAQALGSPLLRVFPGVIPTDPTHASWVDAREAVEMAAALGIVIALENFGSDPGGTSAEVLRVLSEIAAPALKTNIDIGNYTTHGEDVVAVIHALGDRAVYAHLKDKSGGERDSTTYLGGGTMPLPAIMSALNALPQEIIYCFEFAGGGEPEKRIAESVKYLQGA